MATLRLSKPVLASQHIVPANPAAAGREETVAQPIPGPLPVRGDVVSCRFPLAERPDEPGEKARPCVVLNAYDHENLYRRALMVAYGTSVIGGRQSRTDCVIEDASELAAAGLHRPTKFVGDRARVLPYNRRYFRANRFGSTVIGSLHEASRNALEGADAFMRALISRSSTCA